MGRERNSGPNGDLLKSTNISKTKKTVGEGGLAINLTLWLALCIYSRSSCLKWMTHNQSSSQALTLNKENPRVRADTPASVGLQDPGWHEHSQLPTGSSNSSPLQPLNPCPLYHSMFPKCLGLFQSALTCCVHF